MKQASRDLMHATYRQARRIAVLLIGGAAVLGGLAMLVLPGPGIAAIVFGLAILGLEFAWARRYLTRLRRTAANLSRRRRRPRRGDDADDAGEATKTGVHR